MKHGRFLTATLSALIVLSLSWSAFASEAVSATPAVPWFADEELVPLGDEELTAVSGDGATVLVSALVGAASSSLAYAVSPGEKSLTGLALAAGAGALVGTVTGTIRTAQMIAQTGTAVVKAADVVIDALVGITEGVLTGSLSHLYNNK